MTEKRKQEPFERASFLILELMEMNRDICIPAWITALFRVAGLLYKAKGVTWEEFLKAHTEVLDPIKTEWDEIDQRKGGTP